MSQETYHEPGTSDRLVVGHSAGCPSLQGDDQQRIADLQKTFPNSWPEIIHKQKQQESIQKFNEVLSTLAKAKAAVPPSKRDRLIAFHLNATTKMLSICKAKNADYAGHGVQADPFANFSRVEALGIATTEQGFLTRMADKMSRLASLTTAGVEAKVKDESVEDTLLDLANYCILLAAYRRDKAGAL